MEPIVPYLLLRTDFDDELLLKPVLLPPMVPYLLLTAGVEAGAEGVIAP